MKKILSISLFIILLTACGSEGSHERPQDIRNKVWNEGQQIAITVKHYVEQGQKEELKEFAHVAGTFGGYKNREDTNESEIKLVESVSDFYQQSLFYGIFGDGVEKNKGYYKALKAVEGIFGEKALDYSNYDVTKLEPLLITVAGDQLKQDEQEDANSPVEQFKRENKISLDAKTVQFNMANNLDKSFAISGVLELDDYYNYGFKKEETHFSTYLIPDDGTYSDGWYLYFSRKDFEELFNDLLNGEKHVLVEAKIPSYQYEEQQGKMANVYTAEW
ncbi:hypothetical protein [Paenibacillus radicis (ex Gao et al. 2016)]|uniref:Lipoprotein n=1 Tax=Paenibacillus radicis (ex Gao et al. 2016) TaxID=1737354 RepID=A0A917M786_9BACL|nr:hypothetical protein [Paenibacillus radicis (ex Gao et al. 2016)]GGG81983.1 hypothetical protein GCM10010918_44130 [Paenibacillus radicis (ex Gao et al. 2016)]